MQLRSERMLNMLSIGAVNYGAIGGGGGADRIKPCDVACALGSINTNYRLAIEVKIGLICRAGLVDFIILIRRNLNNFGWFKPELMESCDFRRKLNFASQCAIGWLMSDAEPKTVDKAKCLGMSVSCFNKTWAVRVRSIYQLISQWLSDGDNALFKALSSDAISA